MFILSFIFLIFNSLELWSVNHTSIYENSESKPFKIKDFLVKYLVIDQTDLLETNIKNTFRSCS